MNIRKHNLNALVYVSLLSFLVITRLLYEGSGTGGIWNYLQVFFIFSGIFILLFNNKSISKASSPVKFFGFFSIYIWCLSLFSLYSFSIESIFYFLVIPYGFMVFIVFYQLGIKTNLIFFRYPIILTFIIVSILFAYGRISDVKGLTDRSEMVINSYYAMVLLPLTLAFINKKYGYIPFTLTLLLILLSGKRAGILAISLMLIVYYFQFSIKEKSKSFINLFSLTLILVTSFYVNTLLENIFDLQITNRLERLLEDGGSGRDKIWLSIIERISSSDIVYFIIGHGFGSTVKDIGINAHNDFLQIFYEYGFIAFFVYILFYIGMIKVYFKMVEYKYPYSRNFAISILAALFLSFFSYFIIEPRIIAFSSLSWGLFLADWDKFRRNIVT